MAVANQRRLKISICGHSQVPDRLDDFNGHEVNIFKQGGATLFDLDNRNSRLGRSLTQHCDIFFLFLGGNDIFLPGNSRNGFVSYDSIKQHIWRVVTEIKKVASQVYVCQLEARDYSNHYNPVWRAHNEHYNSVIKIINKALSRSAPRLDYRVLNLSKKRFGPRRWDGVHFTNDGKHDIWELMKEVVNNYSE